MTYDARPGYKRRAIACAYLIAAPILPALMSPESSLAFDICVGLVAVVLIVHGMRLLERDRKIEDAESWARDVVYFGPEFDVEVEDRGVGASPRYIHRPKLPDR